MKKCIVLAMVLLSGASLSSVYGASILHEELNQAIKASNIGRAKEILMQLKTQGGLRNEQLQASKKLADEIVFYRKDKIQQLQDKSFIERLARDISFGNVMRATAGLGLLGSGTAGVMLGTLATVASLKGAEWRKNLKSPLSLRTAGVGLIIVSGSTLALGSYMLYTISRSQVRRQNNYNNAVSIVQLLIDLEDRLVS